MLEFIQDFFAFLREHKKLWLAPVLILLFLLVGLLLITPAALSPFLYPFF
jgi:hypothetical protein